MAAPLITLTTDFGSGSGYVAEVKGVLLSAIPDVRLIDIAHNVPAQSIRAAEVLLRRTGFAFPLGTTHLVVVDPGVGTERRAIAVESRGMTFVGPDNGVLGRALAQPGARAVVLDRPELFREPVAPTFHGRDVFAPVAAELAAGAALSDVGTLISDPKPSTMAEPALLDGRLRGAIIGSDVFGNLLTNISAAQWLPEWTLSVGEKVLQRHQTYAEAPSQGRPFALVGSDGFVELAVRNGSAAKALELTDSGAQEKVAIWCGPAIAP